MQRLIQKGTRIPAVFLRQSSFLQVMQEEMLFVFKAGSHRLPVLSFLRLCQNEHKAGKQGKNCGTEKCLIDIIKPSQGKNVFTFLPMETRRMVP